MIYKADIHRGDVVYLTCDREGARPFTVERLSNDGSRVDLLYWGPGGLMRLPSVESCALTKQGVSRDQEVVKDLLEALRLVELERERLGEYSHTVVDSVYDRLTEIMAGVVKMGYDV